MSPSPSTIVQIVRNTRTSQFVALVLALYDHLLTFDKEVELVWRKSWSINKVLFFWCRYFGELVILLQLTSSTQRHLSDSTCRGFASFNVWACTTLGWTLQGIMQLRVYALYDRCTPLFFFVLVCYMSEIAAMVVILSISEPYTDSIEFVPWVHLCVQTRTPSYEFAYFLCPLAFDSLLFVLVVWKSIGQFLDRTKGGRYSRGLLYVIMRDSFLYFFTVTAMYVVDALIWLETPENTQLSATVTAAFTIIIGSRLVLNIREVFYAPFDDDKITLRHVPEPEGVDEDGAYVCPAERKKEAGREVGLGSEDGEGWRVGGVDERLRTP